MQRGEYLKAQLEEFAKSDIRSAMGRRRGLLEIEEPEINLQGRAAYSFYRQLLDRWQADFWSHEPDQYLEFLEKQELSVFPSLKARYARLKAAVPLRGELLCAHDDNKVGQQFVAFFAALLLADHRQAQVQKRFFEYKMGTSNDLILVKQDLHRMRLLYKRLYGAEQEWIDGLLESTPEDWQMPKTIRSRRLGVYLWASGFFLFGGVISVLLFIFNLIAGVQ